MNFNTRQVNKNKNKNLGCFLFYSRRIFKGRRRHLKNNLAKKLFQPVKTDMS